MTVLFFAWNAISENHTGCNGIRALDIGIVEAFDMERELIQPQIFFEIEDYAFSVLIGSENFFMSARKAG